METFILYLTYLAYVVIVGVYTVKAMKWWRMPLHIRWDLYPIPHEDNYRYGGSYFEQTEWWKRPRSEHSWRSMVHALKDNFYMGEYFRRNPLYWLFLLPWHLGFILIITFHILCFFTAVAMYFGLGVTADSGQAAGRILYYILLWTGGAAFIGGVFGSIGLIFVRLYDQALRAYAMPYNFFNYIFFLIVYGSGLYAWVALDPTLAEYRAYWLGLVTLTPPHLHPATILHIILFDIFLIYLPMTRSLHYITRIFALYRIRWDDEPNLPGSEIERTISGLLGRRVSWSAPHIPAGKTWAEAATESGIAEKQKGTV